MSPFRRAAMRVALVAAMRVAFVAAFVAAPVPGLAAPAAAGTADRFDTLHARWQLHLTGAATLDRADPDVAAQLHARSRAAQGWLAGMHAAPDATRLWDDIAGFDDPKRLLASAAVTANAARLQQMALAYAAPGAPSHGDVALRDAVLAGTGWLLEHHYRRGKPAFGNWWDWQIGTPLRLLDIVTLMHAEVPRPLRERAVAAVNWHVPDPRYRTRNDGTIDRHNAETGANLLDKSLAAILAGMLARDEDRVALGRDAIGPALDCVETGDGFYRDGSFVQHGWVPYTGSYGAVALADFARLVHLLSGSAWPIGEARLARIVRWARDSYAPWFIDGGMPDALRGRKIATPTQTEHSVGRGMIASLATLAASAPAADATALRAAIKGWMARDRTFGAAYLAAPGGMGISALSLYELGLLKAIAADPAIPAAPEPPGARLYASMDRAILRGTGFAAVVSMTSPRMSAFESGNGENLLGWWTGMGMLALYTADQAQFGGAFWPTVDIRRLPGTTTDRSGSGWPVDWKMYPNKERWVGGATLGRHAALGMAFSLEGVTGSTLHGRKSWFLLGERILAMGAGIGGGAGPAETIVENRRLADPAARFVIDGAPRANGSVRGARWAHLRDDRAGSSIGYVFPHGADVVAGRGERRGAWRALNDQGSTEELSATFQSLALPHGARSDYAYVLLPNASVAATGQAAREPGLRIEANDATAAAVLDLAANVYAANLWRAGSAPRAGRAYVTASGPAAVVLAEEGGQLHLSIAEPTQGLDSLELSVARPVAAVLSADPAITVLATAPRLRLRIDTAKAAGKSHAAVFSLPAAHALTPRP
ncbi:polysaccharide lyase 8 family protein [Pseudoduganella lutea]|uniref:Hyaluronate lyase n=1 Tax=Pseudoduganella lutea TaxID=321985 RepID=A0A4P6KTA2_9BURK|nr:polysaccharide lyase 8 family protein [Pseudoduganella lutea]QBE62130.1 hyaluronate lyase [Pseudoduganella lutea]